MPQKPRTWLQHGTEAEVQAEVVRLLFVKGGKSTLLMHGVLAILLAVVLTREGNIRNTGLWLLAMGSTLMLHAGLAVAYVRSPQPESAVWLKRFRWVVALTGTVWGLGAIGLYPSGSMLGQLAMIFTLLIITTATPIAYSFDLPSVIGFDFPPVLLLCGRLVYEDNPLTLLAAAMALLYLWFIFVHTRRMNDIFHEKVRFSLEAIHRKKLERNHQQAMALLVQGQPLKAILDNILRAVEEEYPDKHCCILLLDEPGRRLVIASAPRLSKFYCDAIEGTVIGDGQCFCGTAAHTKKAVIVPNIQSSPRWQWTIYSDLASRAGLRSCWSNPILDSAGKVLGTLEVYHEVPAEPSGEELEMIDSVSSLAATIISRRLELDALDKIKTSLAAAQHIAKIGSWEWDILADAMQFSDEAFQIFGLKPDSPKNRGEYFLNVIHHRDRERIRELLNAALDGKKKFDAEYWIVLPDKSEKWVHAIAEVIHDKHGLPELMRGTIHDITRNKRHEQQLERAAHYDPLTGVPNRVLLADRLSQALARATRQKDALLICYLDLDGFKPINDTYGHDAGDHVLVEVTRRITSCIRSYDTVARLGGDEFVVLLNGMRLPDEWTAILNRLLESVSQPFEIGQSRVMTTVSIGVAIYPRDDVDGDVLLRHADQAMLIAKQSGKNRYHIYDVENDERSRLHNRFLTQIEEGLAEGQFELFYQPKVELGSMNIIGAEALIRWNHPERGVLQPDEFLRFIENTALDITMGEWVIDQALLQLDQWAAQGFEIEISVNISANHLESEGFIDRLRRQLNQYPRVPASHLQVEVLESAALRDIEKVGAIIRDCRNLGIRFALDDFGTGYSSLTYLSKLPVDTLKIDQSFVRDMLEDRGDMAIVQGIIALAAGFGLRTVAEGIENEAQFRVLREAGCEAGQGFAISVPLTAVELSTWNAGMKAFQSVI
jgi:diguanylate cyclase (GGDEF)-like protein/PAS domain S-box-containing protein